MYSERQKRQKSKKYEKILYSLLGIALLTSSLAFADPKQVEFKQINDTEDGYNYSYIYPHPGTICLLYGQVPSLEQYVSRGYLPDPSYFNCSTATTSSEEAGGGTFQKLTFSDSFLTTLSNKAEVSTVNTLSSDLTTLQSSLTTIFGNWTWMLDKLNAMATITPPNYVYSLTDGRYMASSSTSTAAIKGLISATYPITYNSITGVISTDLATSTQSTTATTDGSGNYTWVYPYAYASAPNIIATAESSSSDMINVQIVSKTATSAVFKANSVGSVNLLSTLLGTAPVGVSVNIDIIAHK